MDQVVGVEPVVPELVKNDFVCREIALPGCPLEAVQCQMESGFGNGVRMGAVAQMPDGGDGENEFLVRVPPYDIVKDRRAFAYGEQVPSEFGPRTFETVRHDLSVLGPAPYERSSESDAHFGCLMPEFRCGHELGIGIFKEFLHSIPSK